MFAMPMHFGISPSLDPLYKSAYAIGLAGKDALKMQSEMERNRLRGASMKWKAVVSMILVYAWSPENSHHAISTY